MSSKKKISISFRNQNQKPEQEIEQAKQEQAAATEPQNKGDSLSYENHISSNQIYPLPLKKQKKTRRFPLKHILISSLTALLISLGLGFLLLRMFVTLTDETTTGADVVPITSQDSQQTEQVVNASSPIMDSSVVNSYFVQAGVFSTKDKAIEWKNRLMNKAVSTIIWERGGQFYLFAGNAPTKSEADVLAGEFAERDIPVYVKPWSMLKGDSLVEGVEAQVVGTMLNYLESHSLDTVSKNDREEIINQLETGDSENSLLLEPLKIWANESQSNLDWIRIARTVEKIMK